MTSKGGTSCICRWCSVKTGQGISLFTLPRDPTRLRLWLQACNREDLLVKDANTLHKYYKICENHFEEKFLSKGGGTRKTLFAEALPTIFRHPAKVKSSVTDSNVYEKFPKKIVVTSDTDPLEITEADSFSLFGDSAGNIEFVVESDDDPVEPEPGTEENPIIIHITKLQENKKQLVIARENLSKFPAVSDGHSQVVDLDLPTSEQVEIKDEITIEDEVIQIVEEDESEDQLFKKGKNDAPKQMEVDKNKSIGFKKKNTRCYVPGCTVDEKEEDKILWFKVPIDKNLKKIWDICIDRPDKRLDVEDNICHQHFSESDLIYVNTANKFVMTKKLKDGAVPCIKFHDECCVPTCRKKTGQMFSFPVLRTSNLHLWLYLIKNPDLKNLTMKEVLKYRVCALHFDADCFDTDHTLKSTAAPTLHIPDHNISPLMSGLSVKPTHQGNSQVVGPTTLFHCAYLDCLNTSLTVKTMYKFPQEAERCIAWLKACKRGGLISTPDVTVKRMASGKLGVCGNHFGPHQFESAEKLKPDAVPQCAQDLAVDHIRKSIAYSVEDSDSSNETIIRNEGAKEKPKSPSFAGICTYRDCYNKASGDNPFFSFPIERLRSEKWLKACGLQMSSPSSRYQILKNQRICSKHFLESMFESKYKLKPDAVPIPYKKGKEEEKATAENKEAVKQPVKRAWQFDPTKIIFCAVNTCPNNYGVSPGKGKFPDPVIDSERFNIWVQLVANEGLNDLSPEEIYKKYMVCLKHFEPQFYMKDGKVGNLSEEAVPTKHLTADIQWFFSSDYFKNRLEKYLKEIDLDFSRSSSQTKEEAEKQKSDGSTVCILEEDGIRFPKTGHYLYVEKKPNLKRKFPYAVYKYFKTGYGLNNDIMVGENIKIHTAIIIDDNDECERKVLQQLLDKRRKKL